MKQTPEHEADELLSAYLDGELSHDERTRVESRLADDPEAARAVADWRTLGAWVRDDGSDERWAGRDLAPSVLAEARRRRAEREGERALEPGGDFGLPFGRSSRGWVWGGVAIAAAVLFGFYARPAVRRPGPAAPPVGEVATAAPQDLDRGLALVRQAAPNLRVVRLETTPEGLVALERTLAARGIQLASNRPLPAPLAAARRLGVDAQPAVSPRHAAAEEGEAEGDAEGQLFFVDAEGPRLAGVLDDLRKEDSIYRVEADRDLAIGAERELAVGAASVGEAPAPSVVRGPSAADQQAGAQAAAPGVAWRIRLRVVTPPAGAAAPPAAGAAQPANVLAPAPPGATGRAPVVFVIQMRKQ